MRQVRPISGSPRVRMRIRPACEYGARRPAITWGSNHVRYVMPEMVLRVTADYSITAISRKRRWCYASRCRSCSGRNETLQGSAAEVFRRFLDDTAAFWRAWVRNLGIPFRMAGEHHPRRHHLEAQRVRGHRRHRRGGEHLDPGVARERPQLGLPVLLAARRVLRGDALNRRTRRGRWSATFDYIINIATAPTAATCSRSNAISGKSGHRGARNRFAARLRGMGPVRIGNQAYSQVQHDVYGAAILAAAHVFFDARLALAQATSRCSASSSSSASAPAALFDQPDAGPWELRGAKRVHTFSSVDVLGGMRPPRQESPRASGSRTARALARAGPTRCIRRSALGPGTRSARASRHFWRRGPGREPSAPARAQFPARRRPALRFHRPGGRAGAAPRGVLFRYSGADDFGVPENAFVVCTSGISTRCPRWDARTRPARCSRAYSAAATATDFLSRSISTRAAANCWGNFPQTYSMVGMINSAMRLSLPWDEAY